MFKTLPNWPLQFARTGLEPRGVRREVARVGGAAMRHSDLGAQLRSPAPHLPHGSSPTSLHINNGGLPLGRRDVQVRVLVARAQGVRGIVHFVHNMAYRLAFPEHVERRVDPGGLDRQRHPRLTAADRATHALHAQRHIRSNTSRPSTTASTNRRTGDVPPRHR